MARVDLKNKAIQAKLVYYGPGLCGKTTNLQYINARLAKGQELMSLATEGDRTIFFDFMPLDLGKLRGLDVNFKLYTVPGQVRYNETRKMVLKNVDGVVFVADSQEQMIDANLESFDNLFSNLEELGIDPKSIPIILQYNKRDLPNVMSIQELDKALNQNGYPTFEASARSGVGVVETLRETTRLVITNLATSLPEQGQKSTRGQQIAPGSQKLGVAPASAVRSEKAAEVPKAAAVPERSAPEKAATAQLAAGKPPASAAGQAARAEPAQRTAHRAPASVDAAGGQLAPGATPQGNAPVERPAPRAAPVATSGPTVRSAKAEMRQALDAERAAPGAAGAAPGQPERKPTEAAIVPQVLRPLEPDRAPEPLLSAQGPKGSSPGVELAAALAQSAEAPKTNSMTALATKGDLEALGRRVEELAASRQELRKLLVSLDQLSERVAHRAGTPEDAFGKSAIEALQQRMAELTVRMESVAERAGSVQPVTPADLSRLDERMAQLVARASLEIRAASSKGNDAATARMEELRESVAGLAKRQVGVNTQPITVEALKQVTNGLASEASLDALAHTIAQWQSKIELQTPAELADAVKAMTKRLDDLHQGLPPERATNEAEPCVSLVRESVAQAVEGLASRADVEKLREVIAGLGQSPTEPQSGEIPSESFKQLTESLATKAELRALAQRIAQLPTKGELESVLGVNASSLSPSALGEVVAQAVQALASKADVHALQGQLQELDNASAFEKLSARIERLTEGLDALRKRVEQLAEGYATLGGRLRQNGSRKPPPAHDSGIGREESSPAKPTRASTRASARPSTRASALPSTRASARSSTRVSARASAPGDQTPGGVADGGQPGRVAPSLHTGVASETPASAEAGPVPDGEPARSAAVEPVDDMSSPQDGATRPEATSAGTAASDKVEQSFEAGQSKPDEQREGATDASGAAGSAGEAVSAESADVKPEVSAEAPAPVAEEGAHASAASTSPDVVSPQPAQDPFAADPEHQNARRIARVMVADLYLYQRDAVEEGIRNDDFFERNKDALADMRETYASRVPQESCRQQDYLGKAITEFITKKRGQLGIS